MDDERFETDWKVSRLLLGLSLTSVINLLAFLSLWLDGGLTFSQTNNPGNAWVGFIVSLSLLATPVQIILILKAAILLSEQKGLSEKHQFLIPVLSMSLLALLAGLGLLAIAVTNF